MKPPVVVTCYLKSLQLAIEAGDPIIQATITRRLIRSMASWRDNVRYIPFKLQLPIYPFPFDNPPDLISLLARDHTILYFGSGDNCLPEAIGRKCYRYINGADTPCKNCCCPYDATILNCRHRFQPFNGERFSAEYYPVFTRHDIWAYTLILGYRCKIEGQQDKKIKLKWG